MHDPNEWMINLEFFFFKHRYLFRVENNNWVDTLNEINLWCKENLVGKWAAMLGDEDRPEGLVFFVVTGDTPEDFTSLKNKYPNGLYTIRENTRNEEKLDPPEWLLKLAGGDLS